MPMVATFPPPLALTILRQGERLFVDLAEVGTLIPRGESRVEDAFLREMAAELRLLATPGFGQVKAREGRGASHDRTIPAPDAVRRQLQRLGGLLLSHLFPEPARARLRAAVPGDLYLRLDEQLLAVPWELAYDGQDFLATKFSVGRQVITSQPLPGAGTMRAADGRLRVLLIADPTESLPQAAAEVEQLCVLLEEVPGVQVTLLGGKNVRKLALLAA